MNDHQNNETYQHLLDAAEKLFATRGYDAVKLRDIAAAVNIHHASLYYYAPKGKKQLFIEVMERVFQRHYTGLTEAVTGAGEDVHAQLHAIADWIVSQPALDLSRMQAADMKAIEPGEADRLMEMAYNSFRHPISSALAKAHAAGTIEVDNPDLVAMAVVSLLQSVHNIAPYFSLSIRQQIGHKLIDLLLRGLLKR